MLTFCGDGNKTLRAGRRRGLRIDTPCRPGVSWADEGLAGPSQLCMATSPPTLQAHTHAPKSWRDDEHVDIEHVLVGMGEGRGEGGGGMV